MFYRRSSCITKEQFAMCLVMRDALGMKHKEIATVLNLSHTYMDVIFARAQRFGFAIFDGDITI